MFRELKFRRFQFLLIFLENKKSTFELPLPPKNKFKSINGDLVSYKFKDLLKYGSRLLKPDTMSYDKFSGLNISYTGVPTTPKFWNFINSFSIKDDFSKL